VRVLDDASEAGPHARTPWHGGSCENVVWSALSPACADAPARTRRLRAVAWHDGDGRLAGLEGSRV